MTVLIDADGCPVVDITVRITAEAGVDCVIICEKPKILPFRQVIRDSLAAALQAPADRIFIKGKTAEGLGPVGKGKAVSVIALCLLEKESP